MNDFPQSLTEARLDLYPEVSELEEDRNQCSEGGWASFDFDGLDNELERLDAVELSDDWFAKFGPVYWCGILNLEPWCMLFENPKYNLLDGEEEMWELLLRYHVGREAGTLFFKFNAKSPINGWLRYYSRTGDVATNVRTFLSAAFHACVNLDNRRRDPSLWQWTEEYQCQECGEYFYDDFSVGQTCPNCGG